jgi:hypothetical protein
MGHHVIPRRISALPVYLHSVWSSYPTGCSVTTAAAEEDAVGVTSDGDEGEAVSAGDVVVAHDPRRSAAIKNTAVLFMLAILRRRIAHQYDQTVSRCDLNHLKITGQSASTTVIAGESN